MNKTFKILLKPLTYLCSYFSWRSLTHILLSVQGNSTWICGIDSRHLNSILWIGYDIDDGNGWKFTHRLFSLFLTHLKLTGGGLLSTWHTTLLVSPRDTRMLWPWLRHTGVSEEKQYIFLFFHVKKTNIPRL